MNGSNLGVSYLEEVGSSPEGLGVGVSLDRAEILVSSGLNAVH